MQLLLDSRLLFVTKQSVVAHVGYAKTQINKARGQNKWVNNPQPVAAPKRENFCWVIEPIEGKMPMRPKLLSLSRINLSHCHASSLEHVANTYRLYDYGKSSKGVFRTGRLVCESIPVDDEIRRFVGLLIFNEVAWHRAKQDHANYWQWKTERNESRWRQQEKGELDYDAKNMMHTIRLLYSAKNMLMYGWPIVRFEGEKQQTLLDIRLGKFAYTELIEMAKILIEQSELSLKKSDLPDQMEKELGSHLIKEVTLAWESQHLNEKK